MTKIVNICHCGTASHTPHEVGMDGCCRYLVDAPRKVESRCWLVGGKLLTDFTLRQQRGYSMHSSGNWSRSPGSVNSLQDET